MAKRTKAPRLHGDEFVSEVAVLRCPACGCEYVHDGGIEAYDNRNDADYEFDDCGGYRGGGLRMRMWCEEGHEFTFHVQHHKGEMLLFTSDERDAEWS